MFHLTSCQFLLFGMIVSLGSSDTMKRLIFGHHHGDGTNCQDRPGNIIQFNCPSKVHTDGQVCHITCIEGYKLTGSPSTITCHKGQWSSTSAKCEAIECPAPSTTNGRVSCSFKGRHTTTYTLGSVCTAHCHKGFAAVNPSFSCISDKHGAKWSAQPSCKGTRCPSPPSVAHGAYHCSSRTYGINTVCTLTCDSGYRAKSSPSSITCQSSVTWSTPSSCVPIACPAPPRVANGVYSCHSTHGSATHRVNALCQLHCNQGYKPSSVKSDIKCGSTGSWSPPASCHAISCPAPPKVANGVYTCNSVKHKLNDVCQLRCNYGYAPGTAHSDITCLSSSAWSVPTSCHAIACPTPPKVSHGVYSCPATHGSATYKLNDVCQLRCKQGHTPSTKDSDIRCLQTNMWSASARCPAVACAAPPKVAYGVYSCNSTHESGTHRLGDKCQLHCNHGYKPSAAHSDVRCLSTALWSASVSCHEIRCPAAPKVAHGSYACQSTVHKLNHVCNLRCGIGFKASSSRSDITCQSTEVWSQPASCVEIQCSPPPNVANGLYACATTIHTFHDVCRLQCADGYTANRQVSNIRCLWNGTWSTPASCEEIKCPAPPNVSNGKYNCASSTSHKLNDVCHLQCSTGYKPSDINSDIKCLYSSKWSAPSACVHVEIGCNTPPIVNNGNYYCGSSLHQLNDSCMLQCDPGFRPSSASTEIYCLASDEWSTPAMCEQIVCPDPKPVLHGSYVCTHSSPFRQNDVCQLHCNPGYMKTSDLIAIVCLSSSTWTSSVSCAEMKCYAPPLVSHGHYKCGNSTSYKVDTVCPLQCDQGYKPSSHSHITCLDEDDWSIAGACEEIQCHAPPKVENGQYHCSHNAVHILDEVCHLQCNNGYRISSNSSEINCLNNGSWSSASTCEEVLCPKPPQLQHGSYVCTNQGVHKLNDACHLQCGEGFKPSLEGHAIYCEMQELWTKPASCEAKRCDDLPKVDNGNAICNSSVHLINTACLVQCDAGFKLASLSDQVFCLEDETWASVSCVAQT